MGDFDASLPPLSRRERRRLSEQRSDDFDFDLSPLAAPEKAESTTPVILTVCTGNICRSPMAELLLRAKLDDLDVRVHSAGTRGLVNREMDRTSQEMALQYGANADAVAAHRARWLQEPLADDADLILAMSREHRTAAVELSPRHVRHTFTVREFARLAATLTVEQIHDAADAAGSAPRARLAAVLALLTGQRGLTAPAAPADDDVVDPYRREHEVYEKSAEQLVPAVDEVARVVKVALRA